MYFYYVTKHIRYPDSSCTLLRFLSYLCSTKNKSMKRNESKYKQVVNHVIDGINNGSYKKVTGFSLSTNSGKTIIYPEIRYSPV